VGGVGGGLLRQPRSSRVKSVAILGGKRIFRIKNLIFSIQKFFNFLAEDKKIKKNNFWLFKVLNFC
jgi:hypothetical protein